MNVPDPVEMLLDELLTNADRKNLKRLLDHINQDDPDTIQLAYRLITTGNETAIHSVRDALDEALGNIANAEYYYSSNADWQQYCQNDWAPHLKNRMAGRWHLAQVAEEAHPTEGALKADILKDALFQLHNSLRTTAQPYDADYSGDATYWRGVAALALANITWVTGDQSDYYRPFIHWAGHHHDIARVVHLATERDTLDPEILETIMREQDTVSAGLRTGVL